MCNTKTVLMLQLGLFPCQLLAQQPFQVNYAGLELSFAFKNGNLQQSQMVPANHTVIERANESELTGFEVAMQCTGYKRMDQNRSGGSPGIELEYIETKTEQTALGQRMIHYQQDKLRHLLVESHYEFYKDLPVIRRHTVVTNTGDSEIGIEYVSSALVNNIGLQGREKPDQKLVIHFAQNNGISEAQWKSKKVNELGWYFNGKNFVGRVDFTSTGSMSTASFLPMAAIEDTETGITWFWQIEHSGPWHWEMAGSQSPYLYLGGPDERFHDAWKNLKPGEKYTSVPVAVGCVKGDFDDAVVALTDYRRTALLKPHPFNRDCPVIFNDYMNCLKGDPTTAKELPLIDAASEVGCDYYVIDAGWYGELGKGWWDVIGEWQPATSRFPNGIMEVMNHIKNKGMHPGIWLEIELAGINSPLKDKPDDWFLQQHGKRVSEGGRYFLDFRNPEVLTYCDGVVDRVVNEYGVKYIKKDYNCSIPFGTDLNAESSGQGMLQHVRSNIDWIDGIYNRHSGLVIENCSGGGMRTDYMMLSRHQIQSSSDQEDYRKYPAILVGSLAAVLPEQLAGWSYPLESSDEIAASFNMVSSMLCRIHLSGNLDRLNPESKRQVSTGIEVYKARIRKYIPQAMPFFPLGMPSITDAISPIALGLKHSDKQLIAVWRLEGPPDVTLPITCKKANIIYPSNLGISVSKNEKDIQLVLPEKYMAVILEIE